MIFFFFLAHSLIDSRRLNAVDDVLLFHEVFPQRAV